MILRDTKLIKFKYRRVIPEFGMNVLYVVLGDSNDLRDLIKKAASEDYKTLNRIDQLVDDAAESSGYTIAIEDGDSWGCIVFLNLLMIPDVKTIAQVAAHEFHHVTDVFKTRLHCQQLSVDEPFAYFAGSEVSACVSLAAGDTIGSPWEVKLIKGGRNYGA